MSAFGVTGISTKYT